MKLRAQPLANGPNCLPQGLVISVQARTPTVAVISAFQWHAFWFMSAWLIVTMVMAH